MEDTTDSLRALATNWSLAGDEKLLNLLKSTHLKIITKCQEVNTKMDEMVSALDNASIDLQNVNNKFMALSNSQFIESRVYEDDADVNTDEKQVEAPPKPQTMDQLTLLKQSLNILDLAHETAEIIDDSDSDDSDVEISVVLKAKDAYSHRPLPYVIGSQSWKNKWHAGLLTEDSDTDSTTSRQDVNIEQYSESDDDIQTDRLMPNNLSTNISNSSSSLHSSKEVEKKTPAAVAAELQAWLGNAPLPVRTEEPDDISPPIVDKTVYKPHKPITSTIFSDEPPPIDQTEDIDSQEEDDIFAEINKKQPYNNSYSKQNTADDLFGNIDDDFPSKVATTAKQKSNLFNDEPEPELFVEKSKITKENIYEESSTKKPVGGISLFGSNIGAESIGAAILKRNRRKSSSSESDYDENTTKNDSANDKSYNSDNDNESHNANAIFDNLFAKAKQAEQRLAKPVIIDKPVIDKVKELPKLVKETKAPVKEKPKTVNDLFSDNIFDDIDDIFTDVKVPVKNPAKTVKSIFDEDDDDLFADIAKKDTKLVTDTKVNIKDSVKKSIFGSDDDLFGETKAESGPSKSKTVEQESQKVTVKEKVYNNIDRTEINDPKLNPDNKKIKTIVPKSIFDSDSDDDIFTGIKQKTPEPTQVNTNKNINTDKKEEDLLAKKDVQKSNLAATEKKIFQSPSLFEEDEIDELFITAHKAKNGIISNKCRESENVPEIIPDIPVHIDNNQVIDNINKNNSKTKEILNNNVNVEDVEPVATNKEEEKTEFGDKIDSLIAKPTSSSQKSSEFLKEDIIETSQDIEKAVIVESRIVEDSKNKRNSVFVDQNIFKEQDDIVNDKLHIDKEEPIAIPQETQPVLSAFDDIFSEPPAFEKTKETKKATNVNALFEDDSDDESLFFKKNDVVTDEKPEIFSPSADFGIFADEPPDLDVDFTTKGSKIGDLFSETKTAKVDLQNEPEFDEWDDGDDNNTIPILKTNIESGNSANNEKEVFNTEDTTTSSKNIVLTNTDNALFGKAVTNIENFHGSNVIDDNLFGAVKQSTNNNATTIVKTSLKSNNNDSYDNLFKNEVPETSLENNVDSQDVDQVDEIIKTKESSDIKKIGKIDTKNFNINVQALVPGASPKKTVKESPSEAIDSTYDTKNYDNAATTEISVDIDPAVVKSISFDSKPDIGVLDNKISKQRAKIQIKRRPSTRKARHEAVRKSTLNDDDDTDLSSSIEEPKAKPNISKENLNKNSHVKVKDEKHTSTEITQTIKEPNREMVDTISDLLEGGNSNNENIFGDARDLTATTTHDKINIHDELKSQLDTNKSKDEIDSSEKSKSNDKLQNISPQSTTKVKYILNDEDIFNTANENDDDIFKNAKTKTAATDSKPKHDTTKEVNTKESTRPKTKSLFDLSDDEEDLFAKPKKKVEVKSKLFDSDSEDDIFSGNKVKGMKKDQMSKPNVKGSLFGDDDDDLFSKKTKTVAESSKVPSKPVVSKSTASEIPFEDPLSMLDDE